MVYLEEITIQNFIEDINTVYGNWGSEQEKEKISIYLNGFLADKVPQRILRSLLFPHFLTRRMLFINRCKRIRGKWISSCHDDF